MKRITVNSSDLAAARLLSRRLARRDPHEDELAGHPFTGRAPASDVPLPAIEADRASASPSKDEEIRTVPVEMESWEVLLAWSVELCRARAAFVVDPQGFVIASRGNVPADGFEGMGAELCFLMEQLDRVDPEAGRLRSLDLHFDGRKVMGVRSVTAGGDAYVVGFVGSRGLSEAVREAVCRQVEFSLGRLG